MCLISLAWRQHPRYPLIALANRDEFYARPTRSAHWWADADMLAGKDMQAGGTWLGVARDGRFAALTNFRHHDAAAPVTPQRPSRGELVRDYLTGTHTHDFIAGLHQRAAAYAGFSLLFGHAGADDGGLHYATNRGISSQALSPGVYGLSNGLLNDPWPKVSSLNATLTNALTQTAIDTDALLAALADPTGAPDAVLPDTGVGLDVERMLAPAFIHSEGYGTRCSTLLLVDADGLATFIERSFDDNGRRGADKTYTWRVHPQLAAAS